MYDDVSEVNVVLEFFWVGVAAEDVFECAGQFDGANSVLMCAMFMRRSASLMVLGTLKL
jgi:hypothetical protein